MDTASEFTQRITDLVALRIETAKIIAAQKTDLALSTRDIATIAEVLGDDGGSMALRPLRPHRF